MTQTFYFPISGVFGTCCKGNLECLLNDDTKPAFFTFESIDVSSNYQQLIIQITDDVASKEDVERYIQHTLNGTNYALVNTSSRKYWLRGLMGLGVGGIILCLSFIQPYVVSLKILTAILSIPLTCLLGLESFREAEIELRRRTLAMDSLFMISTVTAIVMSCAAFFIPGLPMMFETGLLLFGFRYLGIALKQSIFEKTTSPAQYERLIAQKKAKKLIGNQQEEVLIDQLLPGDMIHLESEMLVPLDGWLVPDGDDHWMDVSRQEGSFTPKKFARNAPVLAGMVNKTPCKMQVGLGHTLKYFSKKPIEPCPQGEIWVYPHKYGIHIKSHSDRTQDQVRFVLSPKDLIDDHGNEHEQDILDFLRVSATGTSNEHIKSHLSQSARDQLSRAMVQYAAQYGLQKTASFLQRLDQGLDASSSESLPYAAETTLISRFFVPTVLGIALISGIIAGCFFSPLIAVRCVMAILVSACPCALGFITPLVMHFTKERAKTMGIVFGQEDAIQRFAEVDIVALDIHGTATQGLPKLNITILDAQQKKSIETKLALIEQHSTHYLGKAIYEKVKGNRLLQDLTLLDLDKDLEVQQGGIVARIEGCEYFLGNHRFLGRHGIRLPEDRPGMTYFIAKAEGGYRNLAVIEMHDELRRDTNEAVLQLKQRGYQVHLISGADNATAATYGEKIQGITKIYANCFPIDTLGQKGKDSWIKEWQAAGHRVLMVGDGVNDAPAFKVAYASIVMQHVASDEGINYQAKARIFNHKMMSVVHALDLAQQSLWTIKLNLFFSLIYNVMAVMLTNMLLLACGIMMHPAFCAALMMLQTGFIILTAYRLMHHVLPLAKAPGRVGLFGTGVAQARTASETSVPVLSESPQHF